MRWKCRARSWTVSIVSGGAAACRARMMSAPSFGSVSAMCAAVAAAIAAFVLLSSGAFGRGSFGLLQVCWGLALVLLALGLWLGPAAFGLLLARRSSGRSRRTYRLGALIALGPLLLLETFSVVDALRSYDGYCHGFPDARAACSLAECIFAAALGGSGFALFGWLLLGVPAFVFSALSLLVADHVAH